MFRTLTVKLGTATILFAAAAGMNEVRADGYYYVAESYYVAPPVIYDAFPIIAHAPIVVYQPPVAPQPFAGTYYPLPPRKVRERWSVTPHRTRYRCDYELPNGLEYKYRYKRDGGYVRSTERWDD